MDSAGRESGQPGRGRGSLWKGGQGMIRYSQTGKTCAALSCLIVILLLTAAAGGTVPEAMAKSTDNSKGGGALVGPLEGPEVITDPGQFPKTFQEAPQLAEQVKAGKLPAVAERL